MAETPQKTRADKWLWHARFFKTRSLASKVVSGGHLRLNGNRVEKAAQAVMPGDVLTFAQGRVVRVIRIVAIAQRRGPAEEARTLYEDLTPAPEPDAPREARAGARPTKRDRRALDALKKGEGDR